jgi:hypothetical protein
MGLSASSSTIYNGRTLIRPEHSYCCTVQCQNVRLAHMVRYFARQNKISVFRKRESKSPLCCDGLANMHDAGCTQHATGPPPWFLGNRVSASCPVQNRRRAPCFPLEPATVSPPGSAYKKRPSSLPPLASPRSRRLTCTVPTEITTRTEQEPHEPSPSAGWRRRWRAGRRRRWWWRRAWARWRRSRTRRACAAGTTRCARSTTAPPPRPGSARCPPRSRTPCPCRRTRPRGRRGHRPRRRRGTRTGCARPTTSCAGAPTDRRAGADCMPVAVAVAR